MTKQELDNRKEKAIDLYKNSDMTVREILSELHLSSTTLRKWLAEYEQEHGVDIKRTSCSNYKSIMESKLMTNAYSNDVREKAIKMCLEDGMSVYSVANELGVADTTVSRWVRRHKMTMADNAVQDTDDLKTRAIILIKEKLYPISRTAKELGVPMESVRDWLREYNSREKSDEVTVDPSVPEVKQSQSRLEIKVEGVSLLVDSGTDMDLLSRVVKTIKTA